MRLRSTLLQIAGLLSVAASAVTACSGGPGTLVGDGTQPGADAGPKGGGDDAGPDSGPVACGGCNCGQPTTTSGTASADDACKIFGATAGFGAACDAFCGALPGNATSASYFCGFPADYQTAFHDAQPDGGSPDGGATCPAWNGDVVIQCGYPCLGRRTEGMGDPTSCDATELGAIFANRAYLEAVSVHAFERLERELGAHGAPAALLRAARRARRDEVRHTAMTVRLARRFGAMPSLPDAPSATPARSLFEIARENAVEGCVRETYGAVIGLLEARTSSDGDVRAASERIAADECRHAELSLAVAAWVEPLLTEDERARIRAAVDEAIADLGLRGNARVVEMLRARVWSVAA